MPQTPSGSAAQTESKPALQSNQRLNEQLRALPHHERTAPGPVGLQDAHQLRPACAAERLRLAIRSEEHTSELQSLMRISYAVFCLKKKNNRTTPIQAQDLQ